ncbi:NAD(P)H-dependent oxidoreductase [Hyphobacterium sp.]|uniref:NAD(P)H-dependent oxidoreductase n=1 Tax=Hyphobacterium sp. TaxID=2004662 RepID=UPI003BAD4FAE
MTRICVIDGHPDPQDGHFVSALAEAYADGAESAGHDVSRIRIAALDITFVGSPEDFARSPGDAIAAAQSKIARAEHIVFVFPLWLGTMPAVCKAFWEQVARAGFLLDATGEEDQWPQQKMKGKSVRIIVTMGMPGLAYKLLFGAHSLKALEAGIFRISGFKPVRHSIFGGIGAVNAEKRTAILEKCRELGAAGK